MEENVDNLENTETTVETTIEMIDYTESINLINQNLGTIQDNLTFITLILMLWLILQNFVFKKGWTK